MQRAVLIKAVLIAVLALLLLVPMKMTSSLVAERQARRLQAAAEIAEGWGSRQTITSPFVAVPYRRHWIESTTEVVEGKERVRRLERSDAGVVRIPIDEITWDGKIETSEKARGIHKVRLYGGRFSATGRFTVPARFGRSESGVRYGWGTASFVLGISDPRGLRQVGALEIDDVRHDFAPGTSDAVVARGIHARLDLPAADAQRSYTFKFGFEVAGSESLSIVPLARDTRVTLSADWPHPSFFGRFLPAAHEIGPDRFTARWQVSHFAAQGVSRLAACGGDKPCDGLDREALGVSLYAPIGIYQLLDRSTKYAFLFVGLLFAAVFLYELLKRLAVHPIQYALVGLALAMFFVLLIAASEHIGFARAYLAATLACVGLVTAYFVYVLRSFAAGSGFGAGLAALFGVLYMMLQAEDYSLLAGALVLFGLLAAIMIGTRRIDWYALNPPRRIPTP